jgi:preprotein translocase subunit YajC
LHTQTPCPVVPVSQKLKKHLKFMNNKNTIIGLLLIFGIFVVYSLLMTPSKKEMEAQKRKYDSIAYIQNQKRDA